MPARAMLLAGTGEHDLTKLAEYRAIGGYAQVPKARAMTPDALIAELQTARSRSVPSSAWAAAATQPWSRSTTGTAST